MINSIKLSLLMGPVPIPVPDFVIEALSMVKVELGSGNTQSGFELTFDVPLNSKIYALFLGVGAVGAGGVPFMRVVLLATVNGRSESVVDGVATDIEAQPMDGGNARLIVKGKDLTALMDMLDMTATPFPAMPPSTRVLLLLAKYAAFGVVPQVIPAVVDDPPLPTEQIPQQQGTDYQYIQQLATDAGYVFYLEPGPTPGLSRAYWGPEIRVGLPQPALTTGMDALANVEKLSFRFDREAKSIPIVFFHESQSHLSIGLPIPDITPMNPPLGLVPPLPVRTVNLDDTGRLSSLSALMAGIAYAGQTSDSVFGNGRLDVVRYGRLLKSRQLVGVRGAGLPYDGLYYVKSVSHDIKRGEYKQSFTLARNALISTLPSVPV
jgi:hypothetical protein